MNKRITKKIIKKIVGNKYKQVMADKEGFKQIYKNYKKDRLEFLKNLQFTNSYFILAEKLGFYSETI